MKRVDTGCWAHSVPITMPVKPDIITDTLIKYAVIRALSHHSVSAINSKNPPTVRAVRIPPTINPTPITRVKVAATGMPKYDAFTGINTSTISHSLKPLRL